MRPALGARGVAVDIAHKTPPMGIGNMFRPVSRLPLTLRNVRWEPVCQFDAAKTDLGVGAPELAIDLDISDMSPCAKSSLGP